MENENYVRRYLRKKYGLILLRDDDELFAYEDAVEEFECTGDRSALSRRLAALGLTSEQINWHAAHRGQRVVVCTTPESLTFH